MEIQFPTTAGQLSQTLGLPLIGDEHSPILSLCALEKLEAGKLAFLDNRGKLPAVESGVLLTSRQQVNEGSGLTFLVAENPKRSFATVAQVFSKRPKQSGISDLANVHPGAELAEDVSVGCFATIAAGAKIGRGSQILPYAYVGENVSIGEDSILYPHVVVLADVRIGNQVVIYPHAVIGSDGFGFVESDGSRTAVPQIGTVVIEDEVRIGAGATVDRATLGETRIGRGAKIDNLVHVAHNCEIGAGSILCAQVGIAGSSTLGKGTILGGQVGIADHVKIGDGVMIGAQSGTSHDLKEGGAYFGSPAQDAKSAMRQESVKKRLPEIWKRLRALEKHLGIGGKGE